MFGQNCGVQKPVPENGTQKLLQARHIRDGDFCSRVTSCLLRQGGMAEGLGFLVPIPKRSTSPRATSPLWWWMV